MWIRSCQSTWSWPTSGSTATESGVTVAGGIEGTGIGVSVGTGVGDSVAVSGMGSQAPLRQDQGIRMPSEMATEIRKRQGFENPPSKRRAPAKARARDSGLPRAAPPARHIDPA